MVIYIIHNTLKNLNILHKTYNHQTKQNNLIFQLGIYVVYYLDYTVGGAWWIMVLYLVQVAAVFAVRGRPHTGEAVVAELFPPTGSCLRYWAAPLLSFTWNVVLPITLMVSPLF